MNQPKKKGAVAAADGIDRRGFLKCMAVGRHGSGLESSGGVPCLPRVGAEPQAGRRAGFTFVQISDSHIGFNKPAKPDVVARCKRPSTKINALPQQPGFHPAHRRPDPPCQAGGIRHAGPDAARRRAKADLFYVPGEHDSLDDDGKQYLERFGKNATGRGWYSFDHKGVHFVGLVNVVPQAGRAGHTWRGANGMAGKDVSSLPASTPIVVFAHIPLWSVYPEWGWGTEDSAQALGLLKRFGSVTVLNGHIHQVMQKVEGR